MFLTVALLVLGLSGCVIPITSEVSAGHRFSPEALAFLNMPGNTRDDVIASLGPPLVESHESRTFVYEWEMTRRLYVSEPRDISHGTIVTKEKVIPTSTTRFGLFIAYDEREAIVAHETRKIHAATLEEACVAWRKQLDKR